MPAKRELSMRQLRHLLRLHHGGVSAREIGRRLGVARSTVQDNLKRAAAAGLAWPVRPLSAAPPGVIPAGPPRAMELLASLRVYLTEPDATRPAATLRPIPLGSHRTLRPAGQSGGAFFRASWRRKRLLRVRPILMANARRSRSCGAKGMRKICCEKASGARADLHELQCLLKDLAAGDPVTMTQIDRLARIDMQPSSSRRQEAIVDAGWPLPLAGRAVGRHLGPARAA